MEQNLHQGWTFREAGSTKAYPAEVPGCVHLDLRRNGQIPDPFWGANEWKLDWIEGKDWVYETRFKVAAGLLSEECIDLVADGLDTLATLTLNGHLVARTANMFTGYRWEVKKWIKPGANLLQVRFGATRPYLAKKKKAYTWREWMDSEGGCSGIRKQQCSFGWDWGPRFPTAGIYRALKLEAWSHNRIESLRVVQKHARGAVKLSLYPRLARKDKVTYKVRLSLQGKLVSEQSGLSGLSVPRPQLWWPQGLGAQPLYDLEVQLFKDGKKIGEVKRRLGLRDLVLDRHKDKWGESFQFKVNGLAFFAKGANWIPSHSFVAAADRPWLDGLLTSAVQANMNMLRVWGGGIYESEDFYDLCDEKGLLIWQDFMFACTLYPGDKEFKALVAEEGAYQVQRLAHRACLALWCGNNELEQDPRGILSTPATKKAYDDVFYGILPSAVKRFDGVTEYWPCSPHNPEGYEKGHNNEKAGDAHFWDVWHARKPVKTYEAKKFRFCSEFGMQSYSSPEVAATFCPPEEWNVFSPAMENHQKNAAGNQIILDYVSRLYRFPRDYASLAYLSQLNQAYCMKMGVEHFRRSMPRTMGAIYWQLNDCWPVFSWSSLEFGGGWKALHYAARRFFAPALVSAHVPGDEWLNTTNSVQSSIHDVDVHTVYEGREDRKARLKWTLYHLDGRILSRGAKAVRLRHGQSVSQKKLDYAEAIKRYGARKLVLRLGLESGREVLSENTVLFTAPRYVQFPRSAVRTFLKKTGPGTYDLSLTSPVIQHQAAFRFEKTGLRASDNYFDLFPGEKRTVQVTLDKDLSAAEAGRRLKVWSLVDSY